MKLWVVKHYDYPEDDFVIAVCTSPESASRIFANSRSANAVIPIDSDQAIDLSGGDNALEQIGEISE